MAGFEETRPDVSCEKAVSYMLHRVAADERLRHLMLGTQAYGLLITAFAQRYGYEDLLEPISSLTNPVTFGEQVAERQRAKLERAAG